MYVLLLFVIEVMFLSSFDKPTTILPLVSIFVIMFLPLSKLDHSVFAASPLIEICVPSSAVCSPEFAVNFRPPFIIFCSCPPVIASVLFSPIVPSAKFVSLIALSPFPAKPILSSNFFNSIGESSFLLFIVSSSAMVMDLNLGVSDIAI